MTQPGDAVKPLIGMTCRWDEEKKHFYLPKEYAEAVAEAGGLPVLLPLIPGIAQELAARLDGIVLTGSPSDVDPSRYGRERHPEVAIVHAMRDETDFRLLQCAFAARMPVLGICYGMQSLNVYRGGSLIQHIPASIASALEHNSVEARHEIAVEPGSELASWLDGPKQVRVNSTHHQSVERPGEGLHVVGRASDGVIEAVEGEFRDHFVVAVQWHPERIRSEDPLSARLFAELIKAASAGRTRKADASPHE
jgi:putative glutamine amidotransferase